MANDIDNMTDPTPFFDFDFSISNFQFPEVSPSGIRRGI